MKKSLLVFVLIGITTLCSCSKESKEDVLTTSSIQEVTVSLDKDVENEHYVIHLNDYITVTHSGYDKAAKIHVSVDKEQFYLDWLDKIDFKDESKKAVFDKLYGGKYKYDYPVELLDKFASINRELVTNSDNQYYSEYYKSEDTIRFTCEVDTEVLETYFNYSIEFEPFEYIITDLPEAKLFDPFEDFELKFYGHNGYGNVDINSNYNYYYNNVYLNYYQGGFLANGDTITVKPCLSQESIYLTGKAPSPKEKTFVVSGLEDSSFYGAMIINYIESYDEFLDFAIQTSDGTIPVVLSEKDFRNCASSAYLNSSKIYSFFVDENGTRIIMESR